jgi:hypothetical protein
MQLRFRLLNCSARLMSRIGPYLRLVAGFLIRPPWLIARRLA